MSRYRVDDNTPTRPRFEPATALPVTQLSFDEALATRYASVPQRIRVMSEAWAACNLYCPQCGSRPFRRSPINARAADLICPNSMCGEEYELKSGRKFGRKVVDGAYTTLLQRVQSVTNPNLILLNYNLHDLLVQTVSIIPSFLFTPFTIEPRKPLSPNARRAGWQGCNILLERIPSTGLVKIITDGLFLPEAEVKSRWESLCFLRKTRNTDERTWMLLTLRLIETMETREFCIDDVYKHEDEFAKIFPNNNNIKPKLSVRPEGL